MKKNSILKEFFKYTSASIVSMIGLSCYILADTIFISMDMGKLGLASLNIACPTFSFVFALGLLFGVGGATKFAIHRGAKQENEANTVFTHTMLIVGILATIFLIIGLTASKEIAYLLGADEETIEYSNQYTQIMLCFAPFFMFNTVFQNFVRNDGAPRTAMVAMIAGNLFNILFDYILIFPCKMGMLGAALATGISPIISMAVMTIFFFARKKNHFRVVKCKISATTIGRISALGIPSFMSELSTGILMIIMNNLFYKFNGNDGLAAFSIVVNVAYVVSAIVNGVAQGTQPIISFNYGKCDYITIRKVLKYALITISCLALILYTAVCASAEGITSILNTENDANVQILAPFGLRLYFLYIVVGCFNILFSSYFSAINKASYSQIITLIRCYLAIIPICYLFAYLWQSTGVWISLVTAEAVCLIVTIALYRRDIRIRFYSHPDYIKEPRSNEPPAEIIENKEALV